jgi:glycosyltransferase involved in cell wall biosynthesis
MAAFAKYLPEFGYDPLVLTTDAKGCLPDDATRRIYRASELGRLVGASLRRLIARPVASGAQGGGPAPIVGDSRLLRFLHAVMVPDMCVTWYPLAVRRGLALLRERPIRLLLSSSPPVTSHLVALRLKRLSGLPWVADFRDGWMFEPPNPAPLSNPLRARVELALEGLVVRHADQIVTVNQTIADDFAQRYPGAAAKVVVITNGYDPATLAGLRRERAGDGKLRLVYTGLLGLSRAGTSIDGLLAALRGLRAEEPGLAADLELVLVGGLAAAEVALIAGAGLDGQVRTVGAVPHREALQQQADADVLLLVTVPGPSGVTTNKLFEYLAVGRPILALTGQSHAAALIREHDAGVIVAPDDVAGIQGALRELHRRWRAGELRALSDPRVARFSRPQLTAELAGHFDRLLGEGARGEA